MPPFSGETAASTPVYHPVARRLAPPESATPTPDPIPADVDPVEAIRRWPQGRSLVALVSPDGVPGHAPWSVLAEPADTIITPPDASADRVARDLAPVAASFSSGACLPRDPSAPPLVSGWIGWLSYELGAVLEPAAAIPGRPARRSGWPLMVWQRVEGVLARRGSAWVAAGRTPRIVLSPAAASVPARVVLDSRGDARRAYEQRVRDVIEHIQAGDIYQANIAHQIRGDIEGGGRAFASSLLDRAGPWFGAYIEHAEACGVRAVCSASPELFLEVEGAASPHRRVVTRPMKGTLPGSEPACRLAESVKDRAELDMIVDLMRNDLGRIARTGTVRVEERRTIERHGGSAPGVWQGVATIGAVLRPGVGLLDVLRAVFPAGSVTGAPKISAMRIIESVEAEPRGPYCGCVGFVGDDGRCTLNVAIRTALLEPAGAGMRLSYSVGAGIVADSDPGLEWSETLAKAGVLIRPSGTARVGEDPTRADRPDRASGRIDPMRRIPADQQPAAKMAR